MLVVAITMHVTIDDSKAFFIAFLHFFTPMRTQPQIKTANCATIFYIFMYVVSRQMYISLRQP